MLCVYNIWRVKSLQFQQATTQKKRKIADSLYVEEAEEDEPASRDAHSYLDKLWTLLLAYAMAGSASCTTAPSTAEGLGSNSVEYVEVPLDVIQQYFYRAKRSVSLVPLTSVLSGSSNETMMNGRSGWPALGIVRRAWGGSYKKSMLCAMPTGQYPTSGAPSSKVPSDPVTPVKSEANRWILGNPINGRQVAKILKDGTRLCQAFQHSPTYFVDPTCRYPRPSFGAGGGTGCWTSPMTFRIRFVSRRSMTTAL